MALITERGRYQTGWREIRARASEGGVDAALIAEEVRGGTD